MQFSAAHPLPYRCSEQNTNRNDVIHFDFDANKPKREIINFWSNNQRNENDVQWKFITLLI